MRERCLHPQARAGAFPSRSAEFPSSHPELSQPIGRPSQARPLILFGLALIRISLPLLTIIKRSCLRLTSRSWSNPDCPKSLPGRQSHLAVAEGQQPVLQVLVLHRHLTTTAPPAATLLREPGHGSLGLRHSPPRAAHSQLKAPQKAQDPPSVGTRLQKGSQPDLKTSRPSPRGSPSPGPTRSSRLTCRPSTTASAATPRCRNLQCQH